MRGSIAVHHAPTSAPGVVATAVETGFDRGASGADFSFAAAAYEGLDRRASRADLSPGVIAASVIQGSIASPHARPQPEEHAAQGAPV